MDRAKFFTALRSKNTTAFGARLSQSQVEGIEAILDAFVIHGDGRAKTLAYGLATARREVGPGMQPVREGFKKTDAEARKYVAKHYPNKSYSKPKPPYGHVYYGRGDVQLTHDYNYEKEGLLADPDKALEPKFAAGLMFRGLLDGRWNAQGKGIAYYLPTKGKDDLKNARRTVNVTDHWQEIAKWYKEFLAAIELAGGVPTAAVKATQPEVIPNPTLPDIALDAGATKDTDVVLVPGPKEDETQVVIVTTPEPPKRPAAPPSKTGLVAIFAIISSAIAAAIKYFGG